MTARRKHGVLKVDRLGLGETVAAYLYDDKMTIDQVVKKLKADGISISRKSLDVWAGRNGYHETGSAKRIFSDHVEKKLPSDLKALEGIEKDCLDWFHETKRSFAKKSSAARAEELVKTEKWKGFREKYIGTRPGTNKELDWAKAIITEAIAIVTDEMAHRKFKLLAAKSASSIIQIKLAFSGIIDGAGAGNIIIKPYGEAPELHPGGKAIPVDEKPFNNKVINFKGKNG